jgi:hypothetical protein
MARGALSTAKAPRIITVERYGDNDQSVIMPSVRV